MKFLYILGVITALFDNIHMISYLQVLFIKWWWGSEQEEEKAQEPQKEREKGEKRERKETQEKA